MMLRGPDVSARGPIDLATGTLVEGFAPLVGPVMIGLGLSMGGGNRRASLRSLPGPAPDPPPVATRLPDGG